MNEPERPVTPVAGPAGPPDDSSDDAITPAPRNEPERTVTPVTDLAGLPDDSSYDATTSAPGPTVSSTGSNHLGDPYRKDKISKEEDLPSNPAQWNRCATSEKVGRFIFDFGKFQSGSNVTYTQFLHLRVIWIEHKAEILAKDTTRGIWLRDEYYTRARQLLASWIDWRVYLDSFQVPKNNLHTLFVANNAFWLTRHHIPESISPITKDRRREYPPTNDEQTVNSALVDFLEALTIRHVENASWNIERKAFELGDKKDEGYEARVDGLLRRQSDGRVLAILEVKPCVRCHHQVDIRMQESAQMAAWISSYPDNSSTQTSANFTRLLVSQDRHQIFLTFATFDKSYVAYVSGNLKAKVRQSNGSDSNPFLKMNEFGPFDTKSESHMRCLGYYILAFTLQECGERDGADVAE
ncbi:uncharacterized protein Z518_05619 [Rhinocladiella mackenziei CBS 650.93]|uniref:Uncharacterized protein n=1 Tax=Rhinocladiella mackenziei CBS 650.93 TaxID=1442369 RepID=A0A0D2IG21_9EURO|nr:uncharacterized protein Z518_05619 [Rhinocladiella mackenziei CBS 650.93]KIX04749.1 hypothetical protein Z518_05619 [Rhinocladiella mackenziei CBS 650.93]